MSAKLYRIPTSSLRAEPLIIVGGGHILLFLMHRFVLTENQTRVIMTLKREYSSGQWAFSVEQMTRSSLAYYLRSLVNRTVKKKLYN